MFDDGVTPRFRMRGDVAEDRTLEEASRKPIELPENFEEEVLNDKIIVSQNRQFEDQ